MTLDRVFVYGTLMRGFAHPMSARLSSEAEFLGPAICRGRLYRVAHYPGLLPSEDAGDIVHGELFRLRAPAALMAALDDYEGCGADDAPPTLYIRRRVPVTTDDGPVTEAWTYLYNRPVIETTRIRSGRFLDR